MEFESMLKRSRFMNALAILSAAAGIIFLLIKDVFLGYEMKNPEFAVIIPAALILNAVAIFLLNYLKSGQLFGATRSANEKIMREELSMLRKELKNSSNFNKHNERLYYEVEKLKEIITTNESYGRVISEEEKAKILVSLKKEILESASDNILSEIEQKYSVEIRKDKYLKDLREQCEQVRSRLRKEIESLGRRGNLNLVIGVVTTIAAVTVLATTVLSGNHQLTQDELMAYYIPRLTLSIFIELFSFFFLKLYKAGLNEIKYFQNELTNVEMKFIAAEKAVMSDKEESISDVIKELASTERNFKLSKGESTVELEKFKTDQANNQKIIDALTGLVSAKK